MSAAVADGETSSKMLHSLMGETLIHHWELILDWLFVSLMDGMQRSIQFMSCYN